MISSCDQHESNNGRDFPGIFIHPNFLTANESELLVNSVDSTWDDSQSGRRKKNYGPKINFKKKKIRVDCFNGFFHASDFVRMKLNDIEIIKDFKTIEECFLEYDAKRGSHIEPHMDDCWIW